MFQAAKKLDLRVGDVDGFLRQHRQTSSRIIKRKTKTPPTLLNTMVLRKEFPAAVENKKQNKPQSAHSSL